MAWRVGSSSQLVVSCIKDKTKIMCRPDRFKKTFGLLVYSGFN